MRPLIRILRLLVIVAATGSARSLPGRSGAVSVQVHHAEETEVNPSCSSITADRPQSHTFCSQSAVVLPSSAVPVEPSTTAAAGPGRSYLATHWLSPEDAESPRTGPAPAELSSNTTSSRQGRSPEVSVDVGDVSSLSELDVQLETLNR